MKERRKILTMTNGVKVEIIRDSYGYYQVYPEWSQKLRLEDWKVVLNEMRLMEQIPSDM